MTAASRESESFEELSPISGWNSDRREGSRHSLSKTESRAAERTMAQILIAVREIAARRLGASQRARVNQTGTPSSDKKNLAPQAGLEPATLRLTTGTWKWIIGGRTPSCGECATMNQPA